ncbi:GmrSD restriction endonuclease domain-containing protein [Streptomyces malaysiensis]|uniref:GmrSD restriction endonuclease domain-containing protein n=1 Tax=Streptomyces malaysiensis TaxID=92644 RepID=UPI0036C0C7EB
MQIGPDKVTADPFYLGNGPGQSGRPQAGVLDVMVKVFGGDFRPRQACSGSIIVSRQEGFKLLFQYMPGTRHVAIELLGRTGQTYFDCRNIIRCDQLHIEHLWANHPRRTEKEIPDPVVFRSLRNQIGGLGLLEGRENSSINDMPLHDKAPLYARSNILLGIISPGYNRRNPLLRDFIKTHQLDKLLRSFGPKEAMTPVIQTRQKLYLHLFDLIWNPEQLGFPTPTPRDAPQPDQNPAPQPRATPARRKTARRRTDVAKMLDARILTAGTRIVLTHRSIDHWATIIEDGGVVLNATGGTPYGRVDEAGAVVRGTKTCQGMKEWHIEDETGARLSLRTLRDQAVAAGHM